MDENVKNTMLEIADLREIDRTLFGHDFKDDFKDDTCVQISRFFLEGIYLSVQNNERGDFYRRTDFKDALWSLMNKMAHHGVLGILRMYYHLTATSPWERFD